MFARGKSGPIRAERPTTVDHSRPPSAAKIALPPHKPMLVVPSAKTRSSIVRFPRTHTSADITGSPE